MTKKNAQTAGDGKVVSIHYTLQDDDGEVIDSSRGEEPLAYLHGAHNIVPGLERQIYGKAAGDKLHVDVPPEEGYGLRRGKPQAVPRSAFPADAELEAGMQFVAEDSRGEPMPIWIAEVRGDQVLIDKDHPLAGKTLHFDVEVVAVRDATAQETEHGHPHGEGGHHH